VPQHRRTQLGHCLFGICAATGPRHAPRRMPALSFRMMSTTASLRPVLAVEATQKRQWPNWVAAVLRHRPYARRRVYLADQDSYAKRGVQIRRPKRRLSSDFFSCPSEATAASRRDAEQRFSARIAPRKAVAGLCVPEVDELKRPVNVSAKDLSSRGRMTGSQFVVQYAGFSLRFGKRVSRGPSCSPPC